VTANRAATLPISITQSTPICWHARPPRAKPWGQAFNIAIGRSVTLNETYQLLRGLTQNTRPPVYGPERGGDIKHSLADISKLEMGLGYKPTVGFEEGLQRTVEWYRQSGGQHR
jgi:nucleoside-diphosphate-sugar epimerase